MTPNAEAISNGVAQKQVRQSSNPHPRLRAREKGDEGWHPRKVSKVPVPHLGVIINLATTTEWSENESWSQQVTTMTHTHTQERSIDTEVAR